MRVDFVVPVYNEVAALGSFHGSLSKALSNSGHEFRFIYVNDGSSDGTALALEALAAEDRRVRPLHLSRNFGHQAALAAGLDQADADAVVMMDGDGQHPAQLVPDMIRLWESGYEVVQTQRIDGDRPGMVFKRLTGGLFYRLINLLGETHICEGAADFRLLSRAAVLGLRQLPEYHRFYRGMVEWIGFRSISVPYTPAARIAGHTKYSLRKMLRLAGDGVFSFSLAPLRLALVIGLLYFGLAAWEVVYVLAFWLRGNQAALVPGWSSLMLVLTLSSGIQMILLGILGIYVGMMFQEVKRRPVYILNAPENRANATRTGEVSR